MEWPEVVLYAVLAIAAVASASAIRALIKARRSP
jgi:hypothetical protein